jgi:hypothetical protein
MHVNLEGQKIIIVDKRGTPFYELSASLPAEDCVGFCIDETMPVEPATSQVLCPQNTPGAMPYWYI